MANDHANALRVGAEIAEYRIERLLGHGGFGLTYLARDQHLNTLVAIKEYLPHEFAVRAANQTIAPKSEQDDQAFNWGLSRFKQEARALARFKHPNIVRVSRLIESNNTAYMVMDYERGMTLAEYLKRHGPSLGEAHLLGVMLPVLDGLAALHQAQLVHRDLKPGNIYLRADQAPMLIDFGAAREALGVGVQDLTALYTPGFAPIEQYSRDGKVGPWSDLYALGATIYTCLLGRGIVDAVQRSASISDGEPDPLVPASKAGKGRYSPQLLGAIDWALAFRARDRPQEARELKARLLRSPVKPETPRFDLATDDAPLAKPPTLASDDVGSAPLEWFEAAPEAVPAAALEPDPLGQSLYGGMIAAAAKASEPTRAKTTTNAPTTPAPTKPSAPSKPQASAPAAPPPRATVAGKPVVDPDDDPLNQSLAGGLIAAAARGPEPKGGATTKPAPPAKANAPSASASTKPGAPAKPKAAAPAAPPPRATVAGKQVVDPDDDPLNQSLAGGLIAAAARGPEPKGGAAAKSAAPRASAPPAKPPARATVAGKPVVDPNDDLLNQSMAGGLISGAARGHPTTDPDTDPLNQSMYGGLISSAAAGERPSVAAARAEERAAALAAARRRRGARIAGIAMALLAVAGAGWWFATAEQRHEARAWAAAEAGATIDGYRIYLASCVRCEQRALAEQRVVELEAAAVAARDAALRGQRIADLKARFAQAVLAGEIDAPPGANARSVLDELAVLAPDDVFVISGRERLALLLQQQAKPAPRAKTRGGATSSASNPAPNYAPSEPLRTRGARTPPKAAPAAGEPGVALPLVSAPPLVGDAAPRAPVGTVEVSALLFDLLAKFELAVARGDLEGGADSAAVHLTALEVLAPDDPIVRDVRRRFDALRAPGGG